MPAINAFALFGPGLQQDKVFIKLVHETMPAWIQSIVLTGLVAAIMSIVSSMLNSVSTIFTIDIYRHAGSNNWWKIYSICLVPFG